MKQHLLLIIDLIEFNLFNTFKPLYWRKYIMWCMFRNARMIKSLNCIMKQYDSMFECFGTAVNIIYIISPHINIKSSWKKLNIILFISVCFLVSWTWKSFSLQKLLLSLNCVAKGQRRIASREDSQTWPAYSHRISKLVRVFN